MNTLVSATFAALSLFSANTYAAVDMTSREPQTLEGRVGNFVEPGLFWLTGSDGVKVLVYSNPTATKSIRSGQSVRVLGLVPMDWLKLADQEINARVITSL